MWEAWGHKESDTTERLSLSYSLFIYFVNISYILLIISSVLISSYRFTAFYWS